jgi:hypothetical protein
MMETSSVAVSEGSPTGAQPLLTSNEARTSVGGVQEGHSSNQHVNISIKAGSCGGRDGGDSSSANQTVSTQEGRQLGRQDVYICSVCENEVPMSNKLLHSLRCANSNPKSQVKHVPTSSSLPHVRLVLPETISAQTPTPTPTPTSMLTPTRTTQPTMQVQPRSSETEPPSSPSSSAPISTLITTLMPVSTTAVVGDDVVCPEEHWCCHRCSYQNLFKYRFCNMCNLPRDSDPTRVNGVNHVDVDGDNCSINDGSHRGTNDTHNDLHNGHHNGSRHIHFAAGTAGDDDDVVMNPPHRHVDYYHDHPSSHGHNSNHHHDRGRELTQMNNNHVWICTVCTLVNGHHVQQCIVCGHIRPPDGVVRERLVCDSDEDPEGEDVDEDEEDEGRDDEDGIGGEANIIDCSGRASRGRKPLTRNSMWRFFIIRSSRYLYLICSKRLLMTSVPIGLVDIALAAGLGLCCQIVCRRYPSIKLSPLVSVMQRCLSPDSLTPSIGDDSRNTVGSIWQAAVLGVGYYVFGRLAVKFVLPE